MILCRLARTIGYRHEAGGYNKAWREGPMSISLHRGGWIVDKASDGDASIEAAPQAVKAALAAFKERHKCTPPTP